ncbi:hypothetical protein NA57DRAFT_25333, partial [Rhizodiscina lignyota]
TPASPSTKTHQRFVLTDPVALKYLQEDAATTVLGTPRRLEGYEIYLVEQWACSRTHPTFVITTYTGDPSHTVIASVLSVPTNEEAWSPRLKVYFKALNQYHARRRETPLGTLMVTNLSGFPSSLTVIPIPDGDPKKHREDFFVNENLKRLGCSGRVGISLSKPTAATQAKFYQLYRASDKIDLYKAVIELVKLCQVALTLFDTLQPEYADGLLCDVTEKAINDWWIEIGNDLYNVEPQDGILGPTTVAALLGTLIGARNRLSAYGAQVSKDVFDIETTKRAIAYFQKSQRLPKTRRLDRTTLKRLHSATAKAATNEGWTVPRAVKSTVAELGGKGGEMVMEMVGAKEKAGIADVETVDIEQFVQLVRGERAKWLWYGKPRKTHTGDMFNRLPGPEGMVFRSDEHGGYTWQGQRKDSSLNDPLSPGGVRSSMETGRERLETPDDDRTHMHKLAKRPSNREEGKRGIGKIRNAVGLRSHHHKHDIEEEEEEPIAESSKVDSAADRRAAYRSQPILPSAQSTQDEGSGDLNRVATVSENELLQEGPSFSKVFTETPIEAASGLFSPREPPSITVDSLKAEPHSLDTPFAYDASPVRTPTVGSSIVGSTYHDVDLNELFPVDEDGTEQIGKLLRRTRSAIGFDERIEERRDPAWWPRHLSFSIAEESLLSWDRDWEFQQDPSISEEQNLEPQQQFARQTVLAADARRIRNDMLSMDNLVSHWVDGAIANIKSLEELAEQDIQELDSLYYPRLETYQSLRLDSQEVMAGEKNRLTEVVKDVEVLGAKLEYEINALRSKVEDVEDGVEEFGRQIGAVESMVSELEERHKRKRRDGEGWLSW